MNIKVAAFTVSEKSSNIPFDTYYFCPFIFSAASTCDAIQKILSIVSSDCFKPVSDVIITSQQAIGVRSLAVGSYKLSVCSLPVIVYLAKSGFKTISVKLTTSSNKIPLPCLGKNLHSTPLSLHLCIYI